MPQSTTSRSHTPTQSPSQSDKDTDDDNSNASTKSNETKLLVVNIGDDEVCNTLYHTTTEVALKRDYGNAILKHNIGMS